jgi:hypothetical protein
MPLASVIAGRYSSTYTHPSGSPLDLGITVSPGGYKVNFTPAWRLINGTDAYGENVIDAIWRGWSDVGVSFISKEWKAGTVRASNQAAAYTITGTTNFDSGIPGRRASDIAGVLIMTSTTGAPAVASPTTATFGSVMAREGFNMAWLFDSIERDMPFDFRVLGLTDSGTPAMPRYWAAT